MTNKKKIEVKLSEDVIQEINALIEYGKTNLRYTDEIDPPVDYDEFINAAIFYYLQRIEKLKILTISGKLHQLNKPYKLRNKFKEIAKQKGIRPIDISELTGIDKANISTILNNKNQPSLDYFVRIWVVLGCPPIEEVLYRD
jgi:DNA-binding Xre family transcriptional regulator